MSAKCFLSADFSPFFQLKTFARSLKLPKLLLPPIPLIWFKLFNDDGWYVSAESSGSAMFNPVILNGKSVSYCVTSFD